MLRHVLSPLFLFQLMVIIHHGHHGQPVISRVEMEQEQDLEVVAILRLLMVENHVSNKDLVMIRKMNIASCHIAQVRTRLFS